MQTLERTQEVLVQLNRSAHPTPAAPGWIFLVFHYGRGWLMQIHAEPRAQGRSVTSVVTQYSSECSFSVLVVGAECFSRMAGAYGPCWAYVVKSTAPESVCPGSTESCGSGCLTSFCLICKREMIIAISKDWCDDEMRCVSNYA